jgi:hypothetical protein
LEMLEIYLLTQRNCHKMHKTIATLLLLFDWYTQERVKGCDLYLLNFCFLFSRILTPSGSILLQVWLLHWGLDFQTWYDYMALMKVVSMHCDRSWESMLIFYHFLSWLLAGNIWTFGTWDSKIYNDTHHLP